MGVQYLVQCVPQRGFNERRRSGIVFTAEGTMIQPEQLTAEILADPGLRVIELPAGARIVRAGGIALEGREPADGGPEPGEAESPASVVPSPEAGGAAAASRTCAFVKDGGERCKATPKGDYLYCHAHKDRESAGATVVKLGS